MYRGRSLHTEGRTVIVWAHASATSDTGRTTVRACLDSKAAQPVDAFGNAALKPGATTRWLDEAVLVKGTTWMVSATRLRPARC